MPRRLPYTEFVVLMAMLFATIAFSVDAMLPAMPEIAAELSPDAPNKVQLIITSFIFGMGAGTLFAGPLADAFGRKTVILGGGALYIMGAATAWLSHSLELLLVARFLQGFGASGPRIAVLAIIRDLYDGREMAQLMSFVMLIFTLFPAVAPAIGAGIIWALDWRAIFLAFILFSLVSVAWLWLRQAETLSPAHTRPFRAANLWAGVKEVLELRQVRLVIAALTMTYAMLFATLSTMQPIFDVTFGEARNFHWWFMLIALIAATGSILNARIVVTFGMRRVAGFAFIAQAILAGALTLLGLFSPWETGWAFALFMGWAASVFFMLGLTIGNLNALGMSPLGHMAGMAASILGALGTVAGAVLAVPVGLAFNGTPVPLSICVAVFAILAYLLVRRMESAAKWKEPIKPEKVAETP